jgi:hypothetical protein
VILSADADDEGAQRTLWQRKYRRSHLGKKSYLERGVSEAQYKVYWDSYVQPSWVSHGLDRMKRKEHGRLSPLTVCLDCLADLDGNVVAMQELLSAADEARPMRDERGRYVKYLGIFLDEASKR